MINIQSTICTAPNCVKCFIAVLFGSSGNSHTVCTQVCVYIHVFFAIERCRSGKRNKKVRTSANAACHRFASPVLRADETSEWRNGRQHGWDDACYTPILRLGCQYCLLVRRECIPGAVLSWVFIPPGLTRQPPPPHFSVTLCYHQVSLMIIILWTPKHSFVFRWPCISIQSCKWNQLGAKLFSVYFVNFIYNLYMFRTSPCPSSGGITVFIRHLVQ
jgi:hypothetical protein